MKPAAARKASKPAAKPASQETSEVQAVSATSPTSQPNPAKRAKHAVAIPAAPPANPWAKAVAAAAAAKTETEEIASVPAAASPASVKSSAAVPGTAVKSFAWKKSESSPALNTSVTEEPSSPKDSSAMSVASGVTGTAITFAGSVVSKQPVEELTESKLQWREKQVAIGKSTEAYKRYIAEVPVESRVKGNPDHPATPEKTVQCSKRSWVGQMNKWRRQLHRWDPVQANDASMREMEEESEHESA